MKRVLRLLAYGVAALLAGGLGIFFFVLPGRVEQAMNRVTVPPPYAASPEATALHASITVADLHADSLLWGRDLIQRADRGHVDIPRLADGNVALQVFSVVTKSPHGLNIERNDASSDDIFLLALAQRWPWRTWFSLKERALYQADRLRAMAAAADGKFVIIRTRRDLRIFLDRRKLEPGIVAGLLSIEGAHVLEGDPANVDAMFDAGFRMMSVAHFFDSEMGGSAHGVDKGGLTDTGRDMVRRMEAKKMIVDLSHGSDQQIDDVLAMASAAGRRLAYRRQRHLRQPPQPQRRPAPRHRGQWRSGRHRLLGDGGVRQGCGCDRQGRQIRSRTDRRRPCRAGLGFRRRRAGAVRRQPASSS